MNRFVLLAVLLSTVTGFACAAAAQEAAETGPEGRLRVVYRAPIWFDRWVGPVLSEFEEMYPAVAVEVQNIPHPEYPSRMQLAFASGNVPDLFELNLNQHFDFFAAQGMLQNLQPYVVRNGFPIISFSSAVVDRLSLDGDLNLMPMGAHPGIAAVAYNRTNLDSAGIASPADDWTYDDYLETARKLTVKQPDGRVTRFGTVAPKQWGPVLAALASFGGGWLDSTGIRSALLDKGSVPVYHLIDRLLNQERLAPRDDEMIGHQRASFMGGQSSMCFMGIWEIGTINLGMAEGNEAALAPLPIGPAGRMSAGANIEGFAMAADAPNKEAAWAMLQWMGGEDMQRRVTTEDIGLTPRTAILDELRVAHDPWKAPYVEALLSGEYLTPLIPANFRVGEMRNAIQRNLDPAFAGTMPMDDALRAAHDALQTVLDKPVPEQM